MIRRDLYAVKVYEDLDGGAWCFAFIGRTLEAARNHRAIVEAATSRPYPLVRPKIVHPAQWVVDFYVLAGNEIGG